MTTTPALPPTTTQTRPSATFTSAPTATPTPGPSALTLANAGSASQQRRWGRGVVRDFVWAPSGQELALASTLGVYLLDPTGRRAESVIAADQDIAHAAYSPDGRFLAVGDTHVDIWDLATRQRLLTLPGQFETGVRDLAFSPGGTWLVAVGTTSGGGDPGAREIAWRATDWTVAHTWEIDSCGAGIAMAIAPDGRQMARLWCGRVELVRTGTGERTLTLPEDRELYSATFAPDDPNLLIASGSTAVIVFDVATQTILRTLDASTLDNLAASPDGDALLLPSVWSDAQHRWVTQVIDAESGRLRFEHPGYRLARFAPDGRTLAAIRSDGLLQILSAADGALLVEVAWPARPSSLAFGPSRWGDATEVLAIGHANGWVTVRDLDTDRIRFSVQVGDAPVTAVALDPAGQWLAAGGWNDDAGHLILVDLEHGAALREIDITGIHGAAHRVEALAFSQDGTALAARVDSFGEIRAWSTRTGAALSNADALLWFHAAALGANASGHRLTLDYIPRDKDGYHGDLSLTDRFTGALLMPPQDADPTGVCQELQRFAQSGDGRYLVMGCDQPALAIWDLHQGGPARLVQGHTGVSGDGFYGNILAVAFAPFDALLATAGYDGTVRLWDASNGQAIAVLSGHTEGVLALDWSADGRYLASASWDGTVRVWGLGK